MVQRNKAKGTIYIKEMLSNVNNKKISRKGETKEQETEK
jgi:hypothetical protein